MENDSEWSLNPSIHKANSRFRKRQRKSNVINVAGHFWCSLFFWLTPCAPLRSRTHSYSVLANTKHFDFTLPYRSDRGEQERGVLISLRHNTQSCTYIINDPDIEQDSSFERSYSTGRFKALLINADIRLKYTCLHWPWKREDLGQCSARLSSMKLARMGP